MNKDSMYTVVKKAYFAGGCFWCLESAYRMVEGVINVVSGYAGGHVKSPNYERVCQGDTGHAEVVEITYNPHQVSYHDLLKVFFTIHDPTTLNKQGNDIGTQYRSAIFVKKEEEAEMAKNTITKLTEERIFSQPIVT